MRLDTRNTVTELPADYDPGQRRYLAHGMRAEHVKFCSEKGGKGPWRKAFRDFIDIEIEEYSERNGPFVVKGNSHPFEHRKAITPEGVLKFCRSWHETDGVKADTLHLADAFLRAVGHPTAAAGGPSMVRILGRSTAFQYHDPSREIERQTTFFSNVCGLHELKRTLVHIPGPMTPETLLVWLQEVPDEAFLICRVVPLPTKLDNSRFTRAVTDRSDWNEDHFVGFGVMSREGLSCHLTSTVAKEPLYLLIKMDDDVDIEPATAAFVSYMSPGYIAEYQSLKRNNEAYLSEYFDNRAWVI